MQCLTHSSLTHREVLRHDRLRACGAYITKSIEAGEGSDPLLVLLLLQHVLVHEVLLLEQQLLLLLQSCLLLRHILWGHRQPGLHPLGLGLACLAAAACHDSVLRPSALLLTLPSHSRQSRVHSSPPASSTCELQSMQVSNRHFREICAVGNAKFCLVFTSQQHLGLLRGVQTAKGSVLMSTIGGCCSWRAHLRQWLAPARPHGGLVGS